MHAKSSHKHKLVDDPVIADLILLAGDTESLKDARANPLSRRFPEKTMAYSEVDEVIPYLPGVYCSAANERGLKLHRTQSNIYFSRYGGLMNTEIWRRLDEPKTLLFCFRGRKNCRVRANIIDYPYNRADVQVIATTSGYMHWKDGVVGDDRRAQHDFADELARSHFALCPRGIGFGSIRLFEAMEMGVAPVLISDHYALPAGPDWDSFLIKVPERNYGRLPQLLEPYVPESAERGRKARETWERFFAPELAFDRVIDQLYEIRRRRVIPERVYRTIWPILGLQTEGRIWFSESVLRRRVDWS
ncbi:MAG TPA: exostosin family protein [Acidobacteriaceae bacterium]|nr:exostosin family protein [Acidobacteriaceae bacterium]